MYGTKRTPTWTMLSDTAKIGDKTITLLQAVDWKVNEHIVIATTDFDNFHSE